MCRRSNGAVSLRRRQLFLVLFIFSQQFLLCAFPISQFNIDWHSCAVSLSIAQLMASSQGGKVCTWLSSL